MLERIVFEAVQHGRHPPGEALRQPDAAHAGLGVSVEQVGLTRIVEVGESPGEDADVGDCEVHPLGSGRRDDVRGVTGEEEPAVLHRLDGEAAHRRDASTFLEDWSLGERPAFVCGEPRVQLFPNAFVRPVLDVVIGVALDVEAGKLGRAHAVQGEAALVVRVDQLLRRGRCLGEDPEPGERVLPLVHDEHALRYRRPAHPVEAVAPGYEVASQLVVLAILLIADGRLLRLEVFDADGFGFEDDLSARLEPGGDEVFHHLVLAVDRDRASPGELEQVDAVALPVEPQLDAVVDHPLPLHPVADARLVQQVDRALLQHARPDPVLYVIAAAGLEHDRLDTLQVQQVREQQPRRSTPDDPNLCAHVRCSSITRHGCRTVSGAADVPGRASAVPPRGLRGAAEITGPSFQESSDQTTAAWVDSRVDIYATSLTVGTTRSNYPCPSDLYYHHGQYRSLQNAGQPFCSVWLNGVVAYARAVTACVARVSERSHLPSLRRPG